MMLFMAVGCGGGVSTSTNTSPNKETQLSVTFKQSPNEKFQKADRTDVQSVRLSISKGSSFYLESASMTKDAVTKKWGIGVNLDNSLAPFDVVAIARDSVDNSGKVLFRTKIGTVIEDLTANFPIVLEEVEDAVSSTNLPILKNVTHTTNGNVISINFVVQNTSSYALSSLSGGTFDTPTGTVSDSTEASFSATYTKGTGESIVNLKAILTNADGSSRTFSFSISEDVLSVNFPPEVVVNVEEQLIPSNTFKLTATVTDDDSTSWTYAWGKIRGAKALASDGSTPNVFEIESLSNDEAYPLCFALSVTDDSGASSSLDYCIKNADNGYLGLKKTGQTKSYAQDGTEVTDGSVQDDGFYEKGLTPKYTRDNTAQTVTDHVTGLVWQDDKEVKTSTYTWEEAKSYCENKGNGWYLPSIQELSSIIDWNSEDSINNVFTNGASFYFSSTNYKLDESSVWIQFFGDKAIGSTEKEKKLFVRCVRDK
jgi:hypothetical protein